MSDMNPKQTELLATLVAIEHNDAEIARRMEANVKNSARTLELLGGGVTTGDPIHDFCILHAGGKDDPELYTKMVEVNEHLAECSGQVAMLVRTSWVYSHEVERSIARGEPDVWIGVLTGEPLVLPSDHDDDSFAIPCMAWTMVGRTEPAMAGDLPWYLPMAFLRQPQNNSMTWDLMIGTNEVSQRINGEDFFPMVSPEDYLLATTAIGWIEGRPKPEVVNKFIWSWLDTVYGLYRLAQRKGEDGEESLAESMGKAVLMGIDPDLCRLSVAKHIVMSEK